MQSKQLLHLKNLARAKKKPLSPTQSPHLLTPIKKIKQYQANTKLCLNLTLSQFTNNVFIKFDAVHCILCTVAFV